MAELGNSMRELQEENARLRSSDEELRARVTALESPKKSSAPPLPPPSSSQAGVLGTAPTARPAHVGRSNLDARRVSAISIPKGDVVDDKGDGPASGKAPLQPGHRGAAAADARANSPSSPNHGKRRVRRLSRDLLAAFEPGKGTGVAAGGSGGSGASRPPPGNLSPVLSEGSASPIVTPARPPARDITAIGTEHTTPGGHKRPSFHSRGGSARSAESFGLGTPASSRSGSARRGHHRGVVFANVLGDDGDSNIPPAPLSRAVSTDSASSVPGDPVENLTWHEGSEKTEAAMEALDKAMRHYTFASLNQLERERVIEAMQCAEVDVGVEIVIEGTMGDLVYVVEAGSLSAYEMSSPTGTSFGPGDLIGALALHYTAPRTETVISDTPCRLWALRAFEFRRIVAQCEQELVNSRYEWLSSVPLLHRALSPPQIVACARAMTSVTFSDGELIIKTGDVGDAFFIVQSGTVVCRVKVRESGSMTDVATLSAGQYFGEMALLNDTPRSADVVAKGSVTCLKMARGPFERILGPLQELLDEEARRRKEDLERKRGEKAAGARNVGRGRASRVIDAERMAALAQLVDSETGGRRIPFDMDDVEVVGLLGEGSFAIVQLVRYRGAPAALKRLSKFEIAAARQTEHIVRERRLLSAVDHPFIVALQGTLQDEAALYLLLEFVAGGELWGLLYDESSPLVDNGGDDAAGADLSDDLKPIGMREDAARFYAACVVEVLNYLHSRGVAYRDLKPENVLINSDGYIKVTDFGFSKSIPFTTSGGKLSPQSHTFLGSPEYLAPEIIMHKGHDKAVDLWSLGVLIYELLMGRTPFAHEHQQKVFEFACSGQVQHMDVFAEHFPSAADLVSKLLNPDPAMRLGALRGGVGDVMAHGWFSCGGIDFDALRERRHDPGPPFVPELVDAEDRSRFDLAGDEDAEAAASRPPEPFDGDQAVFAEF